MAGQTGNGETQGAAILLHGHAARRHRRVREDYPNALTEHGFRRGIPVHDRLGTALTLPVVPEGRRTGQAGDVAGHGQGELRAAVATGRLTRTGNVVPSLHSPA